MASDNEGHLGIEATAARLGAYLWVESRLWEILGGWVQSVGEPEAKICLDEHSRHMAWRARLWEDRLGELGRDGGEPQGAPANEQAAAAVDALGSSSHSTVEKMAGTYRVLMPRLIVSYAGHLARCSAVSDGPVMRSLRMVLADQAEDWRSGESVTQGLLRSGEDVQKAAAHQARLEALLVGAPDLAGRAASGPLDCSGRLPEVG